MVDCKSHRLRYLDRYDTLNLLDCKSVAEMHVNLVL
jgi:hypothetical protein